MRSSTPVGLQEAAKAVDANTSQRARWIDRLSRYVKGTQYSDRPSWFSTERPLLERAPCIVYPTAKNAIRSNVSMCLGEGRFPLITSSPGEDGEDVDAEYGLNETDSATLDAFINGPLKKHVRLGTVARAMLRRSQGEKTAVAVICARGGRVCVDNIDAASCTPTFAENGRPNEIASLEIRYPFLKEYWNSAESRWGVQALLFRRVIDATSDTTYKPLPAAENGDEPKEDSWVPDPAKTFVHNLGRCPVIWYPHGGCKGDDGDGEAIHEDLLEEIDALNISLSQRHRAAIYAGDPQMVETGVSEDHNQGADGATVTLLVDQAEHGLYVQRQSAGGGQPARRKGAGTVWRYTDPESKVQMLTLPGDALKAIDEHARDVKSKLDESFAVVFLDPGNSALRIGELSGSAIRKLFMRQTSNCDEIREDFADNGLLPLVDMLLWFVATLTGQGKKLRLLGIAKVAKVLSKFVEVRETADGTTESAWMSPELSCKWGEYFDDSADDELARVRVASEAKTGGLVPLESAVGKVADIFGIRNVHEVAEALETKASEQTGALTAALHAHGKSMPDDEELDDDGAAET